MDLQDEEEVIINVAIMLHQLKNYKSEGEIKVHPLAPVTEPISRICPGLYLSGADAAQDKRLLFEHNIEAVLSVIDIDIKYDYASQKIQYKYLYTIDQGDFEIEKHFDPAYTFVMGHIKQGKNVLVHCAAGMSRSPTVVMYILARYLCERDLKGIQSTTCLFDIVSEYVKMKRPVVHPESGFMDKLSQIVKKLQNS